MPDPPYIHILNAFSQLKVSYFWGILFKILLEQVMTMPRYRPALSIMLFAEVKLLSTVLSEKALHSLTRAHIISIPSF